MLPWQRRPQRRGSLRAVCRGARDAALFNWGGAVHTLQSGYICPHHWREEVYSLHPWLQLRGRRRATSRVYMCERFCELHDEFIGLLGDDIDMHTVRDG